jgi:pentalenene oxygenase
LLCCAVLSLLLQFPYICAVVSEALRLYPPGANTLRETGDEHFQLGPYTLPPRTTLVVGTYVMQRDPAIWPEAAAFKPERWLPVSGAVLCDI